MPRPAEGADRLSDAVLSWLDGPIGEVTAVIATVDEDGTPRTAVLGALRAGSASELRFACRRTHTTFVNLQRHGRVSLVLIGPPDVAVSVVGTARVVGQIDALPDNALVVVDVETVKDDLLPEVRIDSGIRYASPEPLRERLEALNAELDVAG